MRLFSDILQEISEKPEDELHNESIEFNKTEKKDLKIHLLKLN